MLLRHLRTRRRSRIATNVCLLISAVVLLLSVSFLHTLLTNDPHLRPPADGDTTVIDSLLEDSDPVEDRSTTVADDRIDELDNDDSVVNSVPDEDDILRAVEEDEFDGKESRVSSRRYYFDHLGGVVRRAFDRRSIDQWEDYVSFVEDGEKEKGSLFGFGSDDVALDEDVRRKVVEVGGIEDLLLLKVGSSVSPLREGWGRWFDAKSDFLRRDRMFRSHLELLNPVNNPFLQDPDGAGVTGLTRGDKLVHKGLLHEFKKMPFLGKKPLEVVQVKSVDGVVKLIEDGGNDVKKDNVGENEGKKVERITLDGNVGSLTDGKKLEKTTFDGNASSLTDEKKIETTNLDRNASNSTNELGRSKNNTMRSSSVNYGQSSTLKNVEGKGEIKSETSGQVYADGKRWGYYPRLHPRLSFSNFMKAFFKKENCKMRVFMVWNSPSWMFTVRHQRGLESLLFNHRNACVVVFSETIELNFFNSFVKDGFKIAVAMPNLDELLKDTPTHVFASAWFEWKKTRYYPTHYSELIRLAALYKYGGIYLDSDVIVLSPLSSLANSVGLEDELPGSQLNGAVMVFDKHSSFIMECLMEFYASYDDTRLRWNGAGLLTRVSTNFLKKESLSKKQKELRLHSSFAFFPISRNNITRYFTSPATKLERARQDALYEKIVNESLAFHFWNSMTSALVPEPESLVARLFNRHCIRCTDVL